MNRIDQAPTDVTHSSSPTDAEPTVNWVALLQECLERAAGLATANGCTADAFTQAALSAYMTKNPAFREQVEAMHLAGQLATLRAQGKIGLA